MEYDNLRVLCNHPRMLRNYPRMLRNHPRMLRNHLLVFCVQLLHEGLEGSIVDVAQMLAELVRVRNGGPIKVL